MAPVSSCEDCIVSGLTYYNGNMCKRKEQEARKTESFRGPMRATLIFLRITL